MNCFKSNLLVTVNLVILLIFDDTYANNSKQKEPKKKIICEEWLESGGYKSIASGLENYVSMYKKYTINGKLKDFETTNEKKYKDNCEGLMQMFVSKGIADTYFCDLYKILSTVSTAFQWCTIHPNVTNAAKKKKNTEITSCIENIKKSGFIFLRGIDNYAYYLTQYKEINRALQQSAALEYVNYIEKEVTKLSLTVLHGSGLWCCLRELKKDGFTENNSSQNNYLQIKVRNFACNKLSANEDGRGYQYCKYVVESTIEDTPSRKKIYPNNELLDATKWCNYYQDMLEAKSKKTKSEGSNTIHIPVDEDSSITQ